MAYEPNNPESVRGAGAGAEAIEDKLMQAGAEVKGRANELGRRASQRAEQVRTAAAGGLDSAAQAVHERADRVAGAAHNAADAMSSGADYLRSNDLRQMGDDLVGVIRNNPGPALLGALALGFLIGRAFARD
jgi:hypothetical protein